MLVLVTYDVRVESAAGQKRLRRVAKRCLDYGVRVQNSVFECVVDQAQYVMLKHAILQEIDMKWDSVRFYRLGEQYQSKIEHYGAKPSVQVEAPLIY